MQTCMENPKKLFEKFNHEINRSTQKEEWTKIGEQLSEDGIYIKDVPTLRKNISNWTRRALVSGSHFQSVLLN